MEGRSKRRGAEDFKRPDTRDRRATEMFWRCCCADPVQFKQLPVHRSGATPHVSLTPILKRDKKGFSCLERTRGLAGQRQCFPGIQAVGER